MSKKIYIPIALATIVALFAGFWLSRVAFAQDSQPQERGAKKVRKVGQVTEIITGDLTIQVPNGEQQTFLLDQETKFRDQTGNELGFEDLEIGRWVLVIGSPQKNQDPFTQAVVLLPDDFDPTKQHRAQGRVTGVDQDASTFSLHTRRRGEVILTINENTRFLGAASDLQGMQESMIADVIAQRMDDESLVAEVVRTRLPIRKYAGQISGVDLGAGTFKLLTRSGDEELTFTVTPETRFRGRDITLQSLADLQPEMIALVVAQKGSDDSLVATAVAAGERRDLPKFDLRRTGQIISIDETSLTMKARDGEIYTFQITEATRFLSRGIRVQGLEDLTEGMFVLVGGDELGSGLYQAQVVIASRRR